MFGTPMLKGINEVEARASTSNTFNCHANIVRNLDSPDYTMNSFDCDD
jgi:hypothetical protein